MRQFSLAISSLLLLSPSLIIAVPSVLSGYSAQRECLERSGSPWRRLSDSILHRLWRPSRSQSPLLSSPEDAEVVGHEGPSGKLLARYGSDMVMRFNISTPQEAAALADAADVLFLDVWEFNADWVDIRVAKDVVPSLLGLLPERLQKSHQALMQDLALAQAIFDSYPSPSSTRPHEHNSFTPTLHSTGTSESLFFQDYRPLSVITPWMRLLANMFPTHVRMVNIGMTYEGRDIPALRVGVHPTNNEKPTEPRKTIIITGGSHAREWISTSTVNYLAWNLITSYGKSQVTTTLLESFDWIFIPTLNPDGYIYTWETDRLWRKNKQPTSLRFCQGVDLDRAFPFHWDGESTKGNPCSESFAGERPFEGVEAKRFADWAKNETENNNVTFVAFLDLHSYSQQILYPYSFSCDEAPPTLENLQELALGLAKAIRTSSSGHQYVATSACEGNVMYTGTKAGKKEKIVFPRMETGGGSALDWFYHELRVQYAYQIKLRDTGSYGFLLPKDNIVPTGKEMMSAILYLGKYLLGEIGFDVTKLEATQDIKLTKFEEGEEEENETDVTVVDHLGTATIVGDENNEDTVMEEYDWELRRRRKR